VFYVRLLCDLKAYRLFDPDPDDVYVYHHLSGFHRAMIRTVVYRCAVPFFQMPASRHFAVPACLMLSLHDLKFSD
jgi:hypothetical protein